jgi:hypothetical protein
VALAERFGPLESIFLSNICWWVETNRKNKKNCYEGRYWTYGSTEAFRKIFTYLSPQQIRRIIDTLREENALITGNFNRSGYDRTLWYTVSDEVMALYDAKNLEKDEIPEENPPPSEPAPEKAPEAENPEPPEPEPEPGKEWEKSQSHLPNSANANGKNPIPIDRIQQMDLPNSINGFAEFDPPIPLLKAVKPAAAPPPAQTGPQKAAAAPIPPDEIRELKARFTQIHPDLIFDDGFYRQALAVLHKTGPGTDYPEWVYQECCTRNPKNFRALYYTLFCKPDILALYQQKKASSPAAEEVVRCPACEKPHPKSRKSCPFCGLDTVNYGNPAAVERQKRINSLPPDTLEQYHTEVSQIFFNGIKQRFKNQPIEKIQDQYNEIDKKYHLLE